MNKFIVIEWPKWSGKSTFIEEIKWWVDKELNIIFQAFPTEEKTGIAVRKELQSEWFSQERVDELLQEDFDNFINKISKDNKEKTIYILDRSPLTTSYLMWGRKVPLDNTNNAYFKKALEEHWVIVYLNAHPETIKERRLGRNKLWDDANDSSYEDVESYNVNLRKWIQEWIASKIVTYDEDLVDDYQMVHLLQDLWIY